MKKIRKMVNLLCAAVMLFTLVGYAGAAEAAEPRYAVYQMGYTLDLENYTYADLMFSMTDKDGKPCFVGLDAISFRTTNPNGSHWKILEYNHSFQDGVFYILIIVQDMEGDTPTTSIQNYYSFGVTPSMVTGRSMSAGSGSNVTPALVSVSSKYVGEDEAIIDCGFAGFSD